MASHTLKKITIDGYEVQVMSAIRDGSGNSIPDTYIKNSSKGIANGVASLDSNSKVPMAQLPDVILGSALYGGNIDGAGACTLTDAFKSKFGITTLTITTNAANSYTGAYFIATGNGTILAGSPNTTFIAIAYNTGDWIISNGSSGYAKIDNTDAVTGVKGNAEATFRVGNVNLTKDNIGLGNVDNTSDASKPISTATQTALNAKQNTLVSGTNIKTVGGTSLLGSGNIAFPTVDTTLSSTSTNAISNKAVTDGLATKQNTITAGTGLSFDGTTLSINYTLASTNVVLDW